MTPTVLDVLGRTPFVRLTTFRRTGEPVDTPVWVVRSGNDLLVRTARSTGKVKRIRADPRVLIGPCTRMGHPLGVPVEARAEIVPDAVPLVERLMADKYPSSAIYLPVARFFDRRSQMRTPVALRIRIR